MLMAKSQHKHKNLGVPHFKGSEDTISAFASATFRGGFTCLMYIKHTSDLKSTTITLKLYSHTTTLDASKAHLLQNTMLRRKPCSLEQVLLPSTRYCPTLSHHHTSRTLPNSIPSSIVDVVDGGGISSTILASLFIAGSFTGL